MRHIYILRNRADNKVVKLCTNFREARYTYVRFIKRTTSSSWIMEKWPICCIGTGYYMDAEIWDGRKEK